VLFTDTVAKKLGGLIITNSTIITVSATERKEIQKIFEVFEGAVDKSQVKKEVEEKFEPTIFIGHGKDKQWIELRDHLRDKHKYKIVYFEEEPRAGDNISKILEDMAERSFMAILIHAGEDLDKLGMFHARENVIHETGYFQSSLGFKKAIVLLEDGCNEFSNIAGIQQIRFSKGKIKEAFGEVLATIKREIDARGTDEEEKNDDLI
jgi:predicted nucleotide-binding protein